MSEASTKIKSFDGTMNFATWQVKMRAILIKEKWWSAVDPTCFKLKHRIPFIPPPVKLDPNLIEEERKKILENGKALDDAIAMIEVAHDKEPEPEVNFEIYLQYHPMSSCQQLSGLTRRVCWRNTELKCFIKFSQVVYVSRDLSY